MTDHSAKITSKGQITLPSGLRRALGVGPGDRVDFVEAPDGCFALVARKGRLSDLKGVVPYTGPALRDEDLVRIVEEARAGRGASAAARAGARR